MQLQLPLPCFSLHQAGSIVLLGPTNPFRMLLTLSSLAVCLAGVVADSERPVDRHMFIWPELPGGSGSGSPYVANGDIGVLFGVNEVGAGRSERPSGAQLLSTSKQDLWQSEPSPGAYFTHLSAAQLVINATGFLPVVQGNVTQDLGAAVLRTVLTDGAMTVRGETWVGEDPFAAVFSSIVCIPSISSSSCDVELTLRENGGKSDLVTRIGAWQPSSGIFLRKENLHHATNVAWTASCDDDILYYNTERSFVLSGNKSTLSMANGSCPWVLDAQSPSTSTISTGACSELQGQWAWLANGTEGLGLVNWVGGASSALCLQGGDAASLVPCSRAPLWLMNSSTGFLEDTAGGGCLMVVPDNANNTLGVGVVVAETSSGSIVPAASAPVPVNMSNLAEGIRYTVSLAAGTNYTVIMSLVTLRDVGCAGAREQTSTCGGGPLEEVAMSVAAMLARAIPSARSSHDAFWSNYWNASAIDLSASSRSSPTAASLSRSPPQPSSSSSSSVLPFSSQLASSSSSVAGAAGDAAQLEKAFYGFMYAFASNVRPGKVTPSLYGVLAAGPSVDWNDQLTLDYNLESVYWGAAITNHADLLSVYAATVTNPALVSTMQQRAATPSVWNSPPSVPWPGKVGSVTGEAACSGSSDDVCHVASDLNHTGGYAGAAWPSTAFPLGDGRPAPTDLATRFVGGLVATPLIQYYEYTRNISVLNSTVYPIVRNNADFYTSYAMPYNSSMVYLPFTCAQEGCACRNGLSWYWRWGPRVEMPLPNMTVETLEFMAAGKGGNGVYPTTKGEHNAHIDIAFASQSLRKAAEYATILGVDADKRQGWLEMLARMPPYPQQALTWVAPNATNVVVGNELSGQPLLVEAVAGTTPAMEQQVAAAGNSTIIWPTCNVEYPITNVAMMWPTDELAHVASREVFEAAKRTAWALDKYTGWTFKGSGLPFANMNGFGLSWPPAVRTSNSTDAPLLASYFANASSLTTATNGIRANGGGCLENIAATAAIAEMLMQSYEGVIRLFPVWSGPANGPASFTTLRAYGAFLVSASVDATGSVAPIVITSEKGTSPCVVDSPWGDMPGVTQNDSGAKIDVWPVSRTRYGQPVIYYAFNTTAGATYTVAGGN